MRRELPQRPNLDHLKSQAKDLLDAHKRGDRDAFARIRESVPAFANLSDDALAAAPFALHDAQSAVAREYGFPSWAALREGVKSPPGPIPPELEAALAEATAQRGKSNDAPTPATVPVLPLRNSVVMPGSFVPLDIHRATSLRAVETAMASEPHFIAIFAQRVHETEAPAQDELHPAGCLAIVRLVRTEPERTFVIVEGVRWVTLEHLEQVAPYYRARVADTAIDRDDAKLAALEPALRAAAHRVADTLGEQRARARAAIDATADVARLADLVMAHLDVSVADKAAYAGETDLVRRVECAIAALAAVGAPPRGA